MADYRSRSYSNGQIQIEPYYGPHPTSKPDDFRSHSVSYTSSSSYYSAAVPPPPNQVAPPPPQQLKKGKSTSGSTSKSWSLKDPEFQRQKRVASYKVYSVEGKVKGSFRKSFRWLKDRYTQVVYGWW